MCSRKVGEKEVWVRHFDIGQPLRHQKGFTVYKVTSTVFPRSFPEGATKIVVWKRYNEFKKLRKELELVFRQLYLKGTFPEFPQEKIFGRFDQNLIDERMKCSLALLEFAAVYPQLFTNKLFVKFFETSYHPKDFESKNETDVTENNSIEAKPTGSEATCLIPERLWAPEGDCDGDDQSMSSKSSSCTSPLLSPIVLEPEDSIYCNSLIKPTNLESKSTTDVTGGKVTTFSINDSGAASGNNLPTPYTLKEDSRKSFATFSCASLDENLDSIFDDYDDLQGGSPTGATKLANSVSCLSLDGISFSALERTTRHREAEDSSHDNPKIVKKKRNGFGFFDFLPLFATKEEPVGSTDRVLAESLTAPYICKAAGYFTVANDYEANMRYELAFEAYKDGIKILLDGAQGDDDVKRRVLARKKIEKYMSKAEAMKCQISEQSEIISPSQSSQELLSPKKKLLGLVQQETSHEDSFVMLGSNVVPSDIEELKSYKVVGCAGNKTLVVVNTDVPGGPKCYACKVLRKSFAPLDPEKPTLIPGAVPFMARLEKWFNTDDSIILVLQYAGGGKLFEFVKKYQSKSLMASCDKDDSTEESNIKTPRDNECMENKLPFLPECECPIKMGPEITGVSSFETEMGVRELLSQNSTYRNFPVASESDSLPLPLGIALNSSDTVVCSFFPTEIPDSLNDSNNGLFVSLSNKDDPVDRNVSIPGIKNSSGNTINGCVADLSDNAKSNLETEEIIKNSKLLLRSLSLSLLEQKLQLEASLKSEDLKIRSHIDLKSNRTVDESVVLNPSSIGSVVSTFEALNTKNQSIVGSEDEAFGLTYVEQDIGECLSPIDDDATIYERFVPECCVKVWAAEMVMALEKLHSQGITYGDLEIENILLGKNGHILLTYRALWNEIDKTHKLNDFSAPEISAYFGKSLWKTHPSADWWSLGVILFLLLVGKNLQEFHPEGLYSQTVINIPLVNCCGESISHSARTLLGELLRVSPVARLGYYGAAEIKSHPFFEGFDWEDAILLESDRISSS